MLRARSFTVNDGVTARARSVSGCFRFGRAAFRAGALARVTVRLAGDRDLVARCLVGINRLRIEVGRIWPRVWETATGTRYAYADDSRTRHRFKPAGRLGRPRDCCPARGD